jgi:hypothetical protein
MFCPTRLTYSVITGSSMNFACRSTSAASSRPRRTSFSVEPLIPAMMPLLIFRFPIKSGFSFVPRGLPGLVDAGVAFSGTFLSSFALEGAWLLAGSCVWVDWAITRSELANSEEASNRAVATREKLFISENLQILRNRPKREKSGGDHHQGR